MRRLRVLVLMHPDFVPPDSTEGYTARQINDWKTEFDVVSTLRAAGHDVRPLGVQEEIKPVRDEIENFKPHVVFQLLEEFHYATAYDQNIASFLELMKTPYTGCNPRGLVLARGAHGPECWYRGDPVPLGTRPDPRLPCNHGYPRPTMGVRARRPTV